MKIRKWIIFLILVSGLIICGLIYLRVSARRYKDSHCLITQLSSRLFDLNTVNVNTSGDLKKTDFRIINMNSGKVVYEDGCSKKGIKNEYGFCLFNIYYKDSLIFEIGHLKFNNWHTNDYTFDFRSVNGKIDPTLTILGPDSGKGELFYKRFERNESGQFYKIIFINKHKREYNEEYVKDK